MRNLLRNRIWSGKLVVRSLRQFLKRGIKLFLVRITCELNEICLDVGNDFLSKHGIKQREKLHLNDNTCKGSEIQVNTTQNNQNIALQNENTDLSWSHLGLIHFGP